MEGNELAENYKKLQRGEAANVQVVKASERANRLPLNILRKFEQSQTVYCQNSEYLTLLSSFPDVKKSD
jgi:hypothetical protein